ncbi:MAG: hypothetical protein AB9869_36650 [Verrucomicrobiia bacterium]
MNARSAAWRAQLVDWFHALPGGADLPSRCSVLNIAESFRPPPFPQSQRTGEMAAEGAQRGLVLLDRVALLLHALAGRTAELD